MNEVKISEASVYKIEPGKKYILAFNQRQLSMRDASALLSEIRKFGADGVAVGLHSGDASEIKIIELPKKGDSNEQQTTQS